MGNPLENWLARHRHPASLVLHAVGIPACFVAAPILAILGMWGWAAAAFLGGYALQFLGHGIEGNRSGEELLVRRLMGKPPRRDEASGDRG
jgi:hypothetical protein